jgi:hypothetical protein
MSQLAWRHGKRPAVPTSPHPQELLQTEVRRSVTLTLYLVQKTDQVMSRRLLIDLFTVACDVIVPIDKRALGVIAPGPDMELEE